MSRTLINHLHLIHKSTNRFFILSLLDLSSIPRAREGAPGGSRRQSPKENREPTVGSMVASLLWAPLGDSFGLIFAPFGDLGASSAIFIAFKPSLLRFLIDFLAAFS